MHDVMARCADGYESGNLVGDRADLSRMTLNWKGAPQVNRSTDIVIQSLSSVYFCIYRFILLRGKTQPERKQVIQLHDL